MDMIGSHGKWIRKAVVGCVMLLLATPALAGGASDASTQPHPTGSEKTLDGETRWVELLDESEAGSATDSSQPLFFERFLVCLINERCAIRDLVFDSDKSDCAAGTTRDCGVFGSWGRLLGVPR